MAAYTTYYPTIGANTVSAHDLPVFYGPSGLEGGGFPYVRGPWDKEYGQRSYPNYWKLLPHQLSDTGPQLQGNGYLIPATPTPFRWHLESWVSPRLAAQTLGGTFDLIMGVYQSHADALFSWRIVIWVSQGPYFLPERGVALDYTEPAGRPWPLVWTGWGLPAPQALAPLVVLAGDYLSVEVGVVAYAAPATNRGAYIQYSPVTGPPPAGVPNPLLTVGSTLTTTRAGHVLFSQPLALLDPPASDVCATPIVITTLPWVDATPVLAELATYDPTTDLPTGAPAPSSDEGLYHTVWWVWTAPTTGTLRVEAASTGGDSALVAYTGACGSLTKVAAALGYNGSVPLLKIPVTAGTTYRFRLGGRNNLSATLLSLAARMVVRPGNDDFASRTVITLPFSETSDLTLATMEVGEPTSPTGWTDVPAQSVWYEWTADATPGSIRVNTMGSLFDSQVTVWTRTPLSTFPVPPATDYYDAFNLPDQATLYHPWAAATAWGGVGLGISAHSAVSPRIAPLAAGNYFDNGESYGLDCEFWGLLRGDFPSVDDWVEIDAFRTTNPSVAGKGGFWVGAKRDGAGYHAQLGRYTSGVSTLLTTSTTPVKITGLGFRRLGTTLYLWVQRAGVWAMEFTTTDAAHLVFLRPAIGIVSAAPGNVAFETVGGSTLCPWLGDLWIEVFSAPWTNVDEDVDPEQYYDQANMVFRPTPGVTYYLTVFSRGGSYWNNYGGSSLSLTISRVTAVPTNETCATALAVTVPAYTTIDITNAADGQLELVPLGPDGDIFTMEQNDSGKVLWYKWTADRAAEMNFNTFGSGFGGPFQEVVLYRGTCGALEVLQADSFNMRHEATQLFFTAEIGTTYYWRVTSQGRISGLVYFFLDVDHETFQTGDVILSDNFVWIFAESGAARRLAYPGYDIPTGSGIDPVTGLLYVASFQDEYLMRLNARLEQVPAHFPTAPGRTPEIPGFFQNGRLYVGHWGPSANFGIDGLVDPAHAIRGFDAATGLLTGVYLAKQENNGTAWLDPARDQHTLHYTSRGRKIMGYDIAADAQLPDVVTLADPYPTYRARAIRHRPNDELLLGDAAEVKRLSPTGTVLQRYAVDACDDLFVLDQDPTSTTFWIGNQDTSEFYRVDIATGAVLLKVPGGHFGAAYMGAGFLCGLTVVGGYRAGVAPPPPSLICATAFPIDDAGPGGACLAPIDLDAVPPVEPPPLCAVPAGAILVCGYGDSGTFRYLSPDGTISYPQPPSPPTPGSGVSACCRLSTGDVALVGGGGSDIPDADFPISGAGVYQVCDLAMLSQYDDRPDNRAGGFCVTADALGYWYVRAGSWPGYPAGVPCNAFTRVTPASVEVARWDIPYPPGFTDPPTWGPNVQVLAIAVTEDGQTMYCWLRRDLVGSPPTPPIHTRHYLHRFSLAGAGTWLNQVTDDYQWFGPGYNSLLVVPGTTDIVVAFDDFNGATGASGPGMLRRYTATGTVVWTAGTPAGAGQLDWQGLAHGLPGDTHFLAWAYDDDATTSSGARYCWFSYATGAPDNTRNFTPDDGAGFQFDSQFVVLMDPVARARGVLSRPRPARTLSGGRR